MNDASWFMYSSFQVLPKVFFLLSLWVVVFLCVREYRWFSQHSPLNVKLHEALSENVLLSAACCTILRYGYFQRHALLRALVLCRNASSLFCARTVLSRLHFPTIWVPYYIRIIWALTAYPILWYAAEPSLLEIFTCKTCIFAKKMKIANFSILLHSKVNFCL